MAMDLLGEPALLVCNRAAVTGRVQRDDRRRRAPAGDVAVHERDRAGVGCDPRRDGEPGEVATEVQARRAVGRPDEVALAGARELPAVVDADVPGRVAAGLALEVGPPAGAEALDVRVLDPHRLLADALGR